MPEEDDALWEAAESRREEVLNRTEGYTGECREEVPFGETFYVSSGGKEFLSCTHNPPHTHPVD